MAGAHGGLGGKNGVGCGDAALLMLQAYTAAQAGTELHPTGRQGRAVGRAETGRRMHGWTKEAACQQAVL